MPSLQLTIEGPGAIAATEELLALPELDGHWEKTSEGGRVIDIATLVTIVGLTVGVTSAINTTLEIAEKIHRWYQRRQADPEQSVEKVIIILPNGERLNLARASVPQIEAGLQQMQ